jgi:hypothetical protein
LLWARSKLRTQIAAGLVNIRLVNPSPGAFLDHGIAVGNDVIIPNDNLMYRDGRADNKPASRQSIQDANLLKVHVGYCFEMVVPFVNRILWGMQALAPGEVSNRVNEDMVPKANRIGNAPAGSFEKACLDRTTDEDGNDGFFGMPIYAQSIIRMQSEAIQ